MSVNDRFSELFRGALNATGDEYDAVERTILEAGAAAVPELERHRGDLDPVARLLAAELLALIADPELRGRAFRYLDGAATFFDDTPAPPRADMIAPDLAMRYGAEPAIYLALRLLKSEGWPLWKGATVIEYLRVERALAATAILIRFVLVTTNHQWRRMALFVLNELADSAFEAKLAEERAWREANGSTLVWPQS